MQEISVIFNNQIIAKSSLGDNVVFVEGRYYFDTSCVNMNLLTKKGEGKQYFCPIKKGYCDYYNLIIDGEVVVDEVGWIYEKVENKSFDNIEGKISFYGSEKGLEIRESQTL